MEHQDEPHKRSTLYLDVDGVLLPNYGLLSDLEYMMTPNGEASREWVHPLEFYHPEIIQALGEVAAKSLVVLSSSRMVQFLHESRYEQLIDTLQIKGALVIDLFRPGLIDLKLDAVRRHWLGIGDSGVSEALSSKGRGHVYSYYAEQITAEGECAVWVDDHITNTTLRHQRKLADLEAMSGIATVVPTSATGLTLDDVEKIGKLLG